MLIGGNRQAEIQADAFGVVERDHHGHARLGEAIVLALGQEGADGQVVLAGVAAPVQGDALALGLAVFNPLAQGTGGQHVRLAGRGLFTGGQLGHVEPAHMALAHGRVGRDPGGHGVGPQVRAVADPDLFGLVLAGVGPHPTHAVSGFVTILAVVLLEAAVLEFLVAPFTVVFVDNQLFALRSFHEHVDVARPQGAQGVGRALERLEALFQFEAGVGISVERCLVVARHDGIANRQDGHARTARRSRGRAAGRGLSHGRTPWCSPRRRAGAPAPAEIQ